MDNMVYLKTKHDKVLQIKDGLIRGIPFASSCLPIKVNFIPPKRQVCFSELSVGDCFCVKTNDVLMKTYETNSDESVREIKAINLSSGSRISINDGTLVEKWDGNLAEV